MARGILVPQSGFEPGPSAVRACSPNHWTAGEFPALAIILILSSSLRTYVIIQLASIHYTLYKIIILMLTLN